MQIFFNIILVGLLLLLACFLIPKLVKQKSKHATTTIAVIALLFSMGQLIFPKLNTWLFSPSLEVLSLTPVCVYSHTKWNFPNDDSVSMTNLGMYFIAEIKNGHETVFISAIDISGRLPISQRQYLMMKDCVGRPLADVKDEWQQKQPYTQISWQAEPTGYKCAVKLEPNEPRHIRFTLWDLIPSGQRQSGYRLPIENYWGYADGSKSPRLSNGWPSANDLFVWRPFTGMPYRIRDDFRTKKISFTLRCGHETVHIESDKIDFLRVISEEQWKEFSDYEICNPGDEQIE